MSTCKKNTADLLRKSGDTVVLLVSVRKEVTVNGVKTCVDVTITAFPEITYALARTKDDLGNIIVSKSLTGGGVQIVPVTVDNPNGNKYTITIPASETEPLLGNYYHESKVFDPLNNETTTFSSDNVEFCKNLS